MNALLEHAQWLRGLAAALVRREAEADDIVQETWLAALRAPPDGARPARPWLSQVLRNAWRMAARTSGRRRARERAAGDVAGSVAATADEVLERAELQRRIADLVMTLEEPYRTAVLLRYYEGQQAKEIALALGVPAGTVRWRITEGLARLRTRLDEAADGDRERWQAWLLPLASPASPRPSPGPASSHPASPLPWLGAMLAVAVGGGAAFWTGRSGRAREQRPSAVATAKISLTHHSESPRLERTDTKEDEMMRAKVKQAAALFGVAIPALVASADTGGRELSRDEHITFCVQRWEKMAACKDEFAAHFSDKLPVERREVHRAKFMKQVLEAGTGPVEPRREKCAASIDRVQPVVTASEVTKARACFAEPDCKTVVACMKPMMDKAPAKKTAP